MELGENAVDIFLTAKTRGTSEAMAIMFACQQAPNSSTDRDVCKGDRRLLDQFDGDEVYVNGIVSEARKHGYNPNPNDTYNPHLAQYCGDPDAWVPHHDAKAHIKRVCEKQNRFCGGHVSNEVKEEESQDVPLAKDIIQDLIHNEIKRDPKAAKEGYKDLAQEMINRHAYDPNASDGVDFVGMGNSTNMGDRTHG